MIILYSKSMCLFVGSGFLVSHSRLRKPKHFNSLSLSGTMSNHNWRVFHPRGDLSLLTDTRHIFSVSCNHATLLDVVPFTEPTQSTLNAVSIYQPCTHTHEIRCFSCIYNMMHHCMSIPCHIYDECYTDNSTHAYHQCILNNYINKHVMSIQYFIHVNISCTHMATSTYNMSFHIMQQHPHNQAIIDHRIVPNLVKKLVP